MLGKRFVAALACAVVFLLAAATAVLAQSPSPEPVDSGWDNIPSGVFLLVPAVIIGAVYLSRHLAGGEGAEEAPRRQGAVSRALAKQEANDGERS